MKANRLALPARESPKGKRVSLIVICIADMIKPQINMSASPADPDATAAELMIVVNRDGTLHRYALQGDEMVALESIHNPDYVAPADPIETLAADVAYWVQSLSEIGNPPERVMLQKRK